MGLKLKQRDAECRLRIASDGFLLQIGRGDRDLYLHMRDRIVQFFEEQDRWIKFIPQVETEEIEDRTQELMFRSKKVIQFGKQFILTFSFELDNAKLLKLKGLFTSNFHNSQFIGSIENEIPDKAFMVRTTDLRGGGDAMLSAEVGSNRASITPLVTSRIRTLERLYRVVQEKFDVDASLVPPQS
jgi:hypothetical protein